MSSIIVVTTTREVMFHLAFVCLSVCLLATSQMNYWSYLCENFTRGASVDKEELVKFWKLSMSGYGSRNFLRDSSALQDRAFFSRIWSSGSQIQRYRLRIWTGFASWWYCSSVALVMCKVCHMSAWVHFWLIHWWNYCYWLLLVTTDLDNSSFHCCEQLQTSWRRANLVITVCLCVCLCVC